MKSTPSTNTQQYHPSKAKAIQTCVQPDIIVHSGIQELDRLLKGFKAGAITYVDGDSELIAELPNHLCVNTYQTFQSPTLYFDGGMCVNPYSIARQARMRELQEHDVLSHVHIS